MASKIDLKAYNFGAKKKDYRSGDILRRVRLSADKKNITQSTGLVCEGILEAIQNSGGYGWAVSSYIKFGYAYSSIPKFTWGLDGTIQLPGERTWDGSNVYSEELPSAITALIDECALADDYSIYQPAIFIPRVIHWHREGMFWLGCYLLVCQVNPECTETSKTVRIHYRFEGKGSPLS